MLKRLHERFATKSEMDPEKLNEYGYRPSAEEIYNPDLDWDDISKLKEQYQFEGDYQCSLCPKKILRTKQELKDHLGSRFHKDNIKRYFKRNKKEFDKKISLEYVLRARKNGIQKYSKKIRKLSWLSLYFKIKKELFQ